MNGGGQRKLPTRESSRDNNDGTIVGSNGFVCRLKQQSTNEGGTRGERVMTASGDDDDNDGGGDDKRAVAAADSKRRAAPGNGRQTATAT